MIWLKFALCVAIILFAGTHLTQYADVIAERTGLGRIRAGLVLLALVTAMPEIVTGFSSVLLVDLPDLSAGTLVGSCSFNLAILAVLDILHKHTPVLTVVSSRQVLLAGWGALLLATTVGGIILAGQLPSLFAGWISIASIIVVVLYMIGVKQIFVSDYEHQLPLEPVTVLAHDDISMRGVYFRFVLAAAGVVGAGIWLSFIGDAIVVATGWHASFVGSLFLAITTSMPELVVAISALRIGAVDMAVADVLGANMLDIAMLGPIDVAYLRGSLFSAVASYHIFTASAALIMSLLVIAGIKLPRQHKIYGVASWYTPVLLALFVIGSYLLFQASSG